MDPNQNPHYRADIDGLRALAVMAVVLFHAFPASFPGGFIGVDIFFVISGYLISSIILNKMVDQSFIFGDFYSRRIKRIFPALILVLVFCHVVGWFLLSPGEYSQLGKHILGGASFSSNLIFWSESGYFDASADTKPLLHLWSLGIEEQFYILWPFILWGAFRWRLNPLLVIGSILAISFLSNLTSSYHKPIDAFYLPLNRFWELLIGALIAYGQIHTSTQLQEKIDSFKNLYSALGLALLLVSLIYIDKNDRFPGWWALLPCLSTALLIIGGPYAWLNRCILSQRILVWIGLISFPLYLWHWPLLTFYRLQSLHDISNSEYIALIVLSVALATVTFLFIEKRFRHSYGMHKLTVLTLGMFAIGFIGFNCYVREGMPFRKIAQEKFNYQLEQAYGSTNCFSQSTSDHGEICTNKLNSELGLSPVFLWGDSHAAHLHAGIMEHASQSRIVLYDGSLSACPPILHFSPRQESSSTASINEECQKHNQDVFLKIQTYKPKIVILAANWMQYDGLNQFNRLSPDQVSNTIDALKTQGVSEIILIGNFPVFYLDQPRLSANLFIPKERTRTFKRLNTQSISTNLMLGDLAKKNDIRFISPSEILCNVDGCLMSTSEISLIPVGADVSHLSKSGSTFFINEIIRRGFLILN
jgi:peptidoglycan/LPS O-acetylase OafA/YrhL